MKSLTSILNEYVQLKEEKKRKQGFSNTFGNITLVESTLQKMSILLEDYVASRDATNKSADPIIAQQEERNIPMSPKRLLTVNATRRKPVTPKKLKTSHAVQQTLSPLPPSYSTYPLEQKSNSSISPAQVEVHPPQVNVEEFTQVLANPSNEEQLIKLMMTDSQLQERIAEYINQHISFDNTENHDPSSNSSSLSNHNLNPSHPFDHSEQTDQGTISPTHLSIGDLNVNLAIDDLLNTIRTDPVVEAKLNGISCFFHLFII